MIFSVVYLRALGWVLFFRFLMLCVSPSCCSGYVLRLFLFLLQHNRTARVVATAGEVFFLHPGGTGFFILLVFHPLFGAQPCQRSYPAPVLVSENV